MTLALVTVIPEITHATNENLNVKLLGQPGKKRLDSDLIKIKPHLAFQERKHKVVQMTLPNFH